MEVFTKLEDGTLRGLFGFRALGFECGRKG